MKKKATPSGGNPGRTNFNRSRRDSLRTLGLAAAAPLVVPSRVLAQSTVKSSTPPPSERLNVALVGLGNAMGRQRRKLFSDKRIFVQAVCDVDSNKVKDYEEEVRRTYRKEIGKFDKQIGYGDHREIMLRDDIDGVVIATPVHWHAAIALDAIRSGKDTLIQSPMSLTIREGQLIEKAAMHHGAVVQCAAPLRCNDDLIKLCELVRNGYLGKIKEIYIAMSYLRDPDSLTKQTVPDELDYDRWLGPAPYAHYHSARISNGRASGWRQFWEYGVRNHGEIGFGFYDTVQWALDRERSGPVEFIPQGVNGAAYASFKYENGPQVILGHPVANDDDIEFVGSHGNLSATDTGNLESDPEELARVDMTDSDQRLPTFLTVEDSWIESMRTRRNPLVNAAVAHRSSSICHLAAIADRLGRAIRWDPEKQEIAADPIASRMLDRPRRAPYTLV